MLRLTLPVLNNIHPLSDLFKFFSNLNRKSVRQFLNKLQKLVLLKDDKFKQRKREVSYSYTI